MYTWRSCKIYYSDIIMSTMASQISSLTIVYSTVYSGADERKHQSSAWLAFVRGIHRWPVNSPHKWPVTRKMFPFGDVIMGVIICHIAIILDPQSREKWVNNCFTFTLVKPYEFPRSHCPFEYLLMAKHHKVSGHLPALWWPNLVPLFVNIFKAEQKWMLLIDIIFLTNFLNEYMYLLLQIFTE